MRKLIAVFLLIGNCFGQGCMEVSADSTSSPQAGETQVQNAQTADRVDEILAKLGDRADEIKTYQSGIEHLSRQPLFDSQTLRTGRMYYLRDNKKSLLRIDFDTIKQDEQPAEEYKEQFFFDGAWLTRVDYQLKEVKKYEMVDVNELKVNETVDAFDLLSEYLPIVGFTGEDKLKKEFNITLAEPNVNEPNKLGLHMEVKDDSVYKDDWEWIDFEIGKDSYLPVKVVILSTQEDVFEISFIDARINEPIDENLFKPVIPQGFVEAEVVPLKRQ
ncbi:MAG: hypothetical protein WC374_02380 [Phycisphaerae bacterium]|jgi:hypothetical protein